MSDKHAALAEIGLWCFLASAVKSTLACLSWKLVRILFVFKYFKAFMVLGKRLILVFRLSLILHLVLL